MRMVGVSQLEGLGPLGRKDLAQFGAHLLRLRPLLRRDRSHARPVRPENGRGMNF